MKRLNFKREFRALYSTSSIIISLVIIVAGIVVVVYYYGEAVECKDVACYQEYLLNCKHSYLVNDGEDYVYRYEILNRNKENYCDVDVSLLKAKSGNIDAEELEGLSMICTVNKFEETLPEDNIQSCSGPLREELQEIIIDRLHNQILANFEKIGAVV